MKFGMLPAIAGLALACAAAAGQTITVDITGDVSDTPPPYGFAQLPGPDGHVSFREAITAANVTPGPQTIEFRIPKSEWWLLDDVALLVQDFDLFMVTGDETTFDFSTQTEFTGDTNPDGNEVGIFGTHPGGIGIPSIWIKANNCVVKGLGDVYQRGNAVLLEGNFNRVIGCVTDGGLGTAVEISGGFGGPSPHGNVVGGTEPGEGNILTGGGGGVSITGPADHNVVIGNVMGGPSFGVQIVGVTDFNMPCVANRVGGPTEAERNIISGSGKYGEEGYPSGTQVYIDDADGTVIEGNYIGTNAAGTAPAPQKGPGGITIRGGRGTVIRNNLISGLHVFGTDHYQGQVFGTAIGIAGAAEDTVIQGNLIGTDFTGTAPVLTHSGIESGFWPGEPPPKGTVIGGQSPGQGNTIAYTQTIGVMIHPTTDGFTISGNSIHGNGALGIDLFTNQGAGVTPNDAGDSDTGANNLQNFPVLTSANVGSGTMVSGTLNSRAGRAYAVEFFANPDCDPSGHGEGAVFLGATQVITDGQGNAAFDAVLPGQAKAGEAVTATATDLATGDTSEFSACIGVTGGCYADCDGSGSLDIDDFICFQTLFGMGDAKADCDGSGGLDIDDFICFQTAFGVGCP